LPGFVEDAVKSAYNRYITYLLSFDPDEYYLLEKVEAELRTKMIHLKMRCSGIRSEWLKVCLLRILLVRLVYFASTLLQLYNLKYIHGFLDLVYAMMGHLLVLFKMLFLCTKLLVYN
jgi:hypothetical protein